MQAAQNMDATAGAAVDGAPRARQGARDAARRTPTDWARSPIAERIALARKMLDGYVAVAEASVLAGCHAKGIDPNSTLAGRGVAGRADDRRAQPAPAHRDDGAARRRGRPPFDPARVRTRPDGRVIVEVFPGSGIDKVLFAGFTAEVWMQPGIKAPDVTDRAAAHYKMPAEKREGKVSLVLGAGNVASIPPTDAIYKMFVEGKVCLIKMNPVNAHVGPFIEKAFTAAIDARPRRRVLRRRRRRQVPRRARRSSTRSTSPARTRPTT